MKRIHLLVLNSYLGPLIMTFFISLFILLMQFLWKYIDELVGKGLEWYVITELLFYASSTFVPLALPLAILLSSLMTFGNLGEHYELVAMKSSGISLWSIMRPLIVLSVFISVFAFYFSNNVLPVANLKFKSLLYDVRKQKLAFDIQEGVFYNGIENFVMRVGKKDKDDKTIRNVLIYNHTDNKGNTDLTVAKSGIMETTPDGRYLILTLYNGYNYRENIDQKDYRSSKSFQRTNFEEQIRRFDLSAFELRRTDEDLFKRNYHMLNISQLNESIDSLNQLYNTRLEIFARDYSRFYFYNLLDTINNNKYDTMNIPSLEVLDILEPDERKEVAELALSQVRNMKRQLNFTQEDLAGRMEWIKKHMIAWHKKFTLSFACFVLFFIGAPLGAIIRKGGFGLPVVFSVIFFVIFHIISITGEKSAAAGALTIPGGMWMASFVLLPLGIFLTYKATTDSPLLDTESWSKRFKKLFRKIHI
ncbi:MAG: LptF/LptG family permease [Bacteroidetes bacterium]|nr:LptF/LptG family permease [Bacteroidota bacterium]